MILNQLGIFGGKKGGENLILASLLTGERERSVFRCVCSYLAIRICRPV